MSALYRRLVLLTLPVIASLCVSCCCCKICGRGPAENLGTDLSNWHAVSAEPAATKEQVWSMREGVIVCQGTPMGYIQTDKSYTNFRFSFEWRWAPGQPAGNSGVFLRINGQPRALPRCIECQLKSGDAGDLYGFHGMGLDGDPARRKQVKNHELGGNFTGVTKIAGNENPPGQWNRGEILANGPEIMVWVNGKLVNQAFGAEIVPGPVGLQSEGGEIHFRNLRLTPIKP